MHRQISVKGTANGLNTAGFCLLEISAPRLRDWVQNYVCRIQGFGIRAPGVSVLSMRVDSVLVHPVAN